MIRTILSVSLLFVLAATAIAQTKPPALDGPDHWDIHDPKRGDLGYDIKIEYWFNDDYCDFFYLEVCDADGNVVADGVIVDCGDGTELDVWSSDSGKWYEWEWKDDHYEKKGGSAAERHYYPHPKD